MCSIFAKYYRVWGDDSYYGIAQPHKVTPFNHRICGENAEILLRLSAPPCIVAILYFLHIRGLEGVALCD